MTILARVDNIHSRTLLHSRHPSGHVITGSFTVNYQEEANLRITLNIPDEEKVEYFEVESPGGETQILSKFEDGMVYFTFAGLLENGLWTYRAKIYTDTIIDKDDLHRVKIISLVFYQYTMMHGLSREFILSDALLLYYC